MKSHYCVTMPDRSVWAVPVRIIAEHRADHFAHEFFGGDIEQSLQEDTLPLFRDESEIVDWARNNMSWEDVCQYAQLVDPAEMDFEQGWAEGEVTYRDIERHPEPKRISAKEFRARGYLQELNRLFAHPLGLALEIMVESDGTEWFGDVWDYRDDPEGMCYADSMIKQPIFRERADAIERERRAKSKSRQRILGYDIQPIPGEND